jgi:ATP-dependent helicase HrpA
VRADLNRATLGVVTEVLPIVTLADQLAERLGATRGATLAASTADMRDQLAALVRPGFITDIGWQRLPDLLRWLRGIERRLEKLPSGPERDQQAMAAARQAQEEYERLRATVQAGPELDQLRWMIEELRVSLFAQQLGTPYPISEKRIYRAMDALAR